MEKRFLELGEKLGEVGGCFVGVGWVSCSILESAPVPFGFRYYWDLVGVGPRGFWN